MFFKCYTSDELILRHLVSMEVNIFFLVDLIVDKFAISNVYSYRDIYYTYLLFDLASGNPPRTGNAVSKIIRIEEHPRRADKSAVCAINRHLRMDGIVCLSA